MNAKEPQRYEWVRDEEGTMHKQSVDGPSAPEYPRVLIRTYRGKHGQATRSFQIDAEALARYGYRPTSSVGMQGGRKLGSAAAGLFLAGPVGGLIGATRRHPDELTVTYVRD